MVLPWHCLVLGLPIGLVQALAVLKALPVRLSGMAFNLQLANINSTTMLSIQPRWPRVLLNKPFRATSTHCTNSYTAPLVLVQ